MSGHRLSELDNFSGPHSVTVPETSQRPVRLCGRQSRTSDPPEWRPTRRIARGKAVFRVDLYCITRWLRGVSFLNRGLGLHFQPVPSKSLVG